MTVEPNRVTPANADGSALPTGEPRVELRLWDGEIIRDVDMEGAKRIVARRLGQWIGTGGRRYVRLVKTITALPAQFRGGMKTTERSRTDAGQFIGGFSTNLQHRAQR